MKPIRLTVVESTTRPGLLSVRVDPQDPTATAFYRALMESGARVGDVLEVRLASRPDRSPTGLPLCGRCGRMESQHTNPLAHEFTAPDAK